MDYGLSPHSTRICYTYWHMKYNLTMLVINLLDKKSISLYAIALARSVQKYTIQCVYEVHS